MSNRTAPPREDIQQAITNLVNDGKIGFLSVRHAYKVADAILTLYGQSSADSAKMTILTNPEDTWDAYCAEVAEEDRSPQGAMAFAIDRLSEARAQPQTAPAGGIDLSLLELLASNEWCADLSTVSAVAREALDEIKRLRCQAEITK